MGTKLKKIYSLDQSRFFEHSSKNLQRLSCKDLSNFDWTDEEIDSVNFYCCYLSASLMHTTAFSDCTFLSGSWEAVWSETLIVSTTHFRTINFLDCVFLNATFKKSTFKDCVFEGANLENTIFDSCLFVNVVFKHLEKGTHSFKDCEFN